MDIRLLGPLTLDGVVLRGGRLRLLAETLVLAGGRPVPVTDLVEAVWDGDPPSDATGALQALVSRLRRSGLPVVSVPGGYRADLRDHRVDVLEARRLLTTARARLAEGSDDDAAAAAEAALGLWQDAVGTAHEVLRTALLRAAVEARLRAGLPLIHLDDLRAAADAAPTDEPLVGLVMRALAADGRESEALSRYEALRAALADRYGTDPSRVVADAHLALLRGELVARPAAAAEPATAAAAHPATAEPPTADLPLPSPPRAPVPGPAWRRPVTPLIGREDDVRAVERALAAGPLVTLVAIGGAGKTRLAVEVAARAAEAGESVHAVELAGIRHPAEVLPALLSTVGGSESSADVDDARTRRVLAPQERLLRAVSDLDGLLVLDNCEHLLDAVGELMAELLAVAPARLRILTTSRAPLGVLGETVHHVGMLRDDDAVRLLESRARAGRPGLAWDVDLALELCQRLDNLPLALELAAARLRSMPLGDVLTGADRRFALLGSPVRGLPERHRGLWAMVDWSWALLEPDEQALLAALAVVPAPFTAELAIAVAGSADASATSATVLALASLVDQSLLSLEEALAGHPARYRMLETVREYGEARLEGAGPGLPDGSRDAVMERLARWCAAEARRLRSQFAGHGQLEALRTTGDERETFSLALRWSIECRRDREVQAVAATLLMHWTLLGLHVEAATWSRALLHSDHPSERMAMIRRTGCPGAVDADDTRVTAAVSLLTATIVGDLRTAAVARRLGRAVDGKDADGDGRGAALFRVAVRLTSIEPSVHLAAANELADQSDAYLSALGVFFVQRSGRTSATWPTRSSTPAGPT